MLLIRPSLVRVPEASLVRAPESVAPALLLRAPLFASAPEIVPAVLLRVPLDALVTAPEIAPVFPSVPELLTLLVTEPAFATVPPELFVSAPEIVPAALLVKEPPELLVTAPAMLLALTVVPSLTTAPARLPELLRKAPLATVVEDEASEALDAILSVPAFTEVVPV